MSPFPAARRQSKRWPLVLTDAPAAAVIWPGCLGCLCGPGPEPGGTGLRLDHRAPVRSSIGGEPHLRTQRISSSTHQDCHAVNAVSGLVFSAGIFRLAHSGSAFADTSLESGEPVAGRGG